MQVKDEALGISEVLIIKGESVSPTIPISNEILTTDSILSSMQKTPFNEDIVVNSFSGDRQFELRVMRKYSLRDLFYRGYEMPYIIRHLTKLIKKGIRIKIVPTAPKLRVGITKLCRWTENTEGCFSGESI